MYVDIDRCTAANGTAWEAKADVAVAAAPTLTDFRLMCAMTLMGTNVTASKLRVFLEAGTVMSTYEYRAHRATLAEADEMYSSPLGQRRLAFETKIGCPRAVVYGTLDLAGTPGDGRYGPYRLVDDPGTDPDRAVVLPHNSATGYAGASPTSINESKVCDDAADWEDRAALATARLGPLAAGKPHSEWSNVLAAEDETSSVDFDLVEVVRRKRPPMSIIRTVRIAAGDHHELSQRYAHALLGGPVDDVELIAFGELTQLVDDATLELEVVP
ncbi:MAG: hypothetical protein GY704_17790 [Phycisphaeraceae bacterium]|nr:hypothetical protein [Phycisphaeraceae bacterium]